MSRFAIGLAMIVSSLCGCTVIHIEGAESVTVSRIGILSIDARPDAPVVVYSVKGFGLVPGQNGATLGYRSEQVAIVRAADDCRIIIFMPPRGRRDSEFWKRLLSEHPNICAVKGGYK